MNRPGQTDRVARALRDVSRWWVWMAVLVGPWLFGSADPWAYLMVCTLIAAGGVCWLSAVALSGRSQVPLRLQAALGILLVYVLFQMIPLPESLARFASPVATSARIEGRFLLNTMGIAEHARLSTPIAAAPDQTWRGFYLILSCVIVFSVMLDTIRSQHALRQMLLPLAAAGFLLAVFGIVQKLSGTRLIYGFHHPPYGGTIFGPFTNRNHFALHMNMLLAIALGLFLRGSGLLSVHPSRLRRWREGLLWLSNQQSSQMLLLAFGAAIMAASVLFSLSRAGIASLAGSVVLAFTLLRLRQQAQIRVRAAGLIVVAVTVLAIWLGSDPMLERFRSLTSVAVNPFRDTRMMMTFSTLRLWIASPFFGVGFGSFAHVFPAFQPPPLQIGRVLFAHNDYAQLLAEGGVVGFALFVWIGSIACTLARRAWEHAGDEQKMLATGLLIGIAAVLIHSMADFGLHKPANAWLFSALCAMTLCALTQPDEEANARDRAAAVVHRRDVHPATAVAGIVLLLVAAVLQVDELGGELAFMRFRLWQKAASGEVTAEQKEIALYAAADEADLILDSRSRNTDALIEITLYGLRSLRHREVQPDLRIRLVEQAGRAARAAAESAPADYEAWLWLARAEGILGRKDEAAACMARARQLAPPGSRLQ